MPAGESLKPAVQPCRALSKAAGKTRSPFPPRLPPAPPPFPPPPRRPRRASSERRPSCSPPPLPTGGRGGHAYRGVNNRLVRWQALGDDGSAIERAKLSDSARPRVGGSFEDSTPCGGPRARHRSQL